MKFIILFVSLTGICRFIYGKGLRPVGRSYVFRSYVEFIAYLKHLSIKGILSLPRPP